MQYKGIFEYKILSKRLSGIGHFPITYCPGCHTITGLVALLNEKAHKGPWEICEVIE